MALSLKSLSHMGTAARTQRADMREMILAPRIDQAQKEHQARQAQLIQIHFLKERLYRLQGMDFSIWYSELPEELPLPTIIRRLTRRLNRVLKQRGIQ